jgi:sulfatase maturation enzyme AslB (radical SAM superfamily)
MAMPRPLAMEVPAERAPAPLRGAPRSEVRAAIDDGVVSGRLWLYSNYHCNLACAYCLTESAARVPTRELGADRMRSLAAEAVGLGFTGVGITGGEPFLLPYLPDVVTEVASLLPTVVLTNGTLFTGRGLARLASWPGLPVQVQVSLDRPDPIENDAMRGPENFRKVVEAIPLLVARGIRVRMATTVERIGEDELARLCELHRGLGIPDEDHLVRPIVRRGRAQTSGMGTPAQPSDFEPELTITADGAFWSPFAPTVTSGRLDTDLMVTRETDPLSVPAEAMVRIARATPRLEGPIKFR